MSKFKQEFNEYKKACYQDKLHPTQEKEVTQAFYAGAFAGFNMLIKAMEDGSDVNVFANNFYKELTTVLQPKE